MTDMVLAARALAVRGNSARRLTALSKPHRSSRSQRYDQGHEPALNVPVHGLCAPLTHPGKNPLAQRVWCGACQAQLSKPLSGFARRSLAPAFICFRRRCQDMESTIVPTREELAMIHWRNERRARQAKKTSKSHEKPDRVRRTDWASQLEDADGSHLDEEEFERITPRGERDRRRLKESGVLLTNAEHLPSEPHLPTIQLPDSPVGETPGLVVEVSSGLCRVEWREASLLCSLRGGLSAQQAGYTNVVAVGDLVRVTPTGFGQGVVEEVLPRSSALARPDVFRPHLLQIIAANVEQLLIVAAWREPAIWPELVDRYLIAAARFHLSPILCVNKIDLAASRADIGLLVRPYQRLGIPVILTSASTCEGIAELRKLLLGRSTALAGLSGVGKSSLLSAAEPGLRLRIGEVSERHHAGKHTTTQAALMTLRGGGYVVDTPGIREFGLSGLSPREVEDYYPEISAAAAKCRYADCARDEEADCAVLQAVDQGEISEMRLASYRKIRATLAP